MTAPNVTCAGCDKPMVSTKAQGLARCTPCSSAHGTQARYRRGCRCDECRGGATERMRVYSRRRKERDGESMWVAQRRARAESSGYVPEAERMVPCAVCGEEVLKRDMSSPIPGMHRACRTSAAGQAVKRRALGIESPRRARLRKRMERAAAGKPATGRVFIQGPCEWCREPFCAPNGKWCSARCKTASKIAARYPLKFNPSPSLRAFVYERDGWECGLCGLPIDKTLTWPNKWAASLDHVIPQSMMLVPDHSAHNLRASHFMCNSLRGNGSNMSEDDVRRRAHAEIGGGRFVTC